MALVVCHGGSASSTTIHPIVREGWPFVRDDAPGWAQIGSMSDVSVLGLGVMGSALARVLVERGHVVTVWNRTAAKAEHLVQRGARPAATAAQAAEASPVVVVCVMDYDQSYTLLGGAMLEGRTLVQLSTGSPNDARTAETWAKQRGAEYLDGAIMATPRQIGTAESGILVSGSARAFAAARDVLSHMAGTISYVGEPVAAAAAFDQAFLSTLFSAMIGLYHALTVVEAEGVSIAEFARLFDTTAPALIQMLRHDADSVLAASYAEPEASIETCLSALRLMVRSAREAGLDAAVPEFGERLFAAGASAGFGAESPAALVKVLRSRARAVR
jgi:3-hydroxyisobutyrate dehydrogenase-like beta-hydroxyacid dehydrogenase